MSTTLKKVKMRKDAKTITEEAVYGKEPTEDTQMIDALNWYARAKTCEDSMRYLVEWVTENDYKDSQIKKLKKCPKYFIPNAYGWMARMDMNGINIGAKYMSQLKAWVKRGMDQAQYVEDLKKEEQKTNEPTTKKSLNLLIKEAIDEKASSIMAEVDEWYDDFFDGGFKGEPDLFSFLEASQAKPKHVEIVVDRIGVYMAEFYVVQEGIDKDFCEAYKFMKPKDVKAVIKWLETLKSQAEQFVKVHKSKKGPRKVKTKYKNIGKLVEKLEVVDIDFQSGGYVAKSLEKSKIIGAKELWAVTPKGDIKRFLSESASGFSISGSTLKNVTSLEHWKAPQRSAQDKEVFRKLILNEGTKFPASGRKPLDFKNFKVVDSTNYRIAKHLIWYVK